MLGFIVFSAPYLELMKTFALVFLEQAFGFIGKLSLHLSQRKNRKKHGYKNDNSTTTQIFIETIRKQCLWIIFQAFLYTGRLFLCPISKIIEYQKNKTEPMTQFLNIRRRRRSLSKKAVDVLLSCSLN